MRRRADPRSAPEAVGELLLRLLLEGAAAPLSASPDFWDSLLQVACGNAVLLRTAASLERLGIDGPERFVAGVAIERERAQALVAGVQRVSRVCSEYRIAHLFPKAFQHYPDMGRDADLLVLARPGELLPVLAALGAVTHPGGFSDWVAATVRYVLPGCPGPLDVQYGTLGLVGEHAGYAAQLVANRAQMVIADATVVVPAVDDQLLLQGVQRIFGRLSLRLADITWAIGALTRGRLNWDYVVRTAQRIGVTQGLGCFLSYVEQIHGRLFSGTLVPTTVRRHLPLRGWGTIEFRDGRYRFPALRVNVRLSVGGLEAKLARRDWAGAARLSLVPLLGVATTLGRLSHARAR
ncbi:MAG: hypothetical protein DMD57_08995 [Gemmatimonadetes bacterium]|nr:MAG: hypothetical protein DMD57_08995 [Gemmatimonadota bacterium]